MGGVHAAGNGGYLAGLLSAGGLLLLSDEMPTVRAYQLIFLIFTTLYLLMNLPAIAAMAFLRLFAAMFRDQVCLLAPAA